MKIGLIDLGGGMRGTYATGILEYCTKNNIKFDCCIGVSAGSSNLINFLSNQQERNYRYYFDYAFRKENVGLQSLFKTGSFFNYKNIYEVYPKSDNIDPIDYDTLMNNPADFFIVAEECASGKTKYFTKKDIKKDDYRVLSASCNIPVVGTKVEIDGIRYYDGGFADPVPIQKALDEGCDKIVLIATRPIKKPRKPTRDNFFAFFLRFKYPKAAKRLTQRAKEYNEGIEFAKKLEKEGKVLILSPENTYGLDTLTIDKVAMQKLYEEGKKDAEKISDWLKQFQIN